MSDDPIESYRKRFWELTDLIEAHDKSMEPQIAERDAMNVYVDKLRELNKAIKAANAKRAPWERERVMLAKGLSGKTGERPAKS